MKLDSDTMNATERCTAIIHHEEPDRLPIYLMGVPVYSQAYKEFWSKEDEIFNGPWGQNDENILLTPLGDFSMQYYFGQEINMYGIHIVHNSPSFLLNPDGKLNDDPTALQQAINNLKANQEVKYVSGAGSIHGIKLLESGDHYTWYEDGYLKKKEDVIAWWDRYGWSHNSKASNANISSYRDFIAKFGDRMFTIPQISGSQLYEATWPIMGQARWAYYCRTDPEFIQKLIDDRKECQLKILDEIAKLKPTIVFGGDDMGQKGRPMLSPDMYRKFFFKPYKEVFDKIHSMGAIAFNHSCGNVVELLPDMIKAGIDGWQSLEPASEIDHVAIKKKYGDKLLLVGGMDSREISFGTKESINKHVKKQILAMGKGGGYIPGPTHDYLTEVTMKNAEIFRDAVYQHGKYPLKE